MKHLILGGARSGKSSFAQTCAQQSGFDVVLIATAESGDAEMAERIARHRAERPAHWRVVEEPFALAAALRAHGHARGVVIVDCLTLWLSNLLFGGATGDRVDDPMARFTREREALLDCLTSLPGQTILVSCEVGLGIVPISREVRRFRDEAGRLNCDIAARCERVTFVAAGLPLEMKAARVEPLA